MNSRFLDRLNTHGVGAGGWTIMTPALTLLMNQSYAERLAHQFFPHMPDVYVPLFGGLLVGFAGLLLYYSRPHNVAQQGQNQ